MFHALDKSSDLKDRSPGYIEVIGHCVPLNSVDSRGHVDKPLEFLTIRDFRQIGRQGANSLAELCFLELYAINDLKFIIIFPDNHSFFCFLLSSTVNFNICGNIFALSPIHRWIGILVEWLNYCAISDCMCNFTFLLWSGQPSYIFFQAFLNVALVILFVPCL